MTSTSLWTIVEGEESEGTQITARPTQKNMDTYDVTHKPTIQTIRLCHTNDASDGDHCTTVSVYQFL